MGSTRSCLSPHGAAGQRRALLPRRDLGRGFCGEEGTPGRPAETVCVLRTCPPDGAPDSDPKAEAVREPGSGILGVRAEKDVGHLACVWREEKNGPRTKTKPQTEAEPGALRGSQTRGLGEVTGHTLVPDVLRPIGPVGASSVPRGRLEVLWLSPLRGEGVRTGQLFVCLFPGLQIKGPRVALVLTTPEPGPGAGTGRPG